MAEKETTPTGLSEVSVTYTLIRDDELIVVENVPAHVDPETGEQFFTPATVEQLQTIIWSRRHPKRILQTPVYEFAA
jgi:hypothetical protein